MREDNLRRIYGIEDLPSDTALREGLDGVIPAKLQQQFSAPLEVLRTAGVLQQRQILDHFVAVSVDGTGHYCSGSKSCPQCMVKNHKSGKTTYYHQLLGAVAVHPDQSTVFPVAWESEGRTCTVNFANGLILNGQYRETLTNFFEYTEVDQQTGEQLLYSSWITDIEITSENALGLVKAARS